ncbi:MAG: hemolysin family protein [Oscillospiraceae bacterium]
MFGDLLLQFLLILLNAVFACAEIAVISVNDNKLTRMAAEGDKRAKRLAKLVSEPSRFLATIQIGITLVNLLGSAFAAQNFSDGLTGALKKTGIPVSESTLSAFSVIIITIALTYFTVVLGELFPKRVAMNHAEKIALGMSKLVVIISKLFAPLVWALTATSNALLRLIGIDPNSQDEDVTEEEIRMMVDVGSEKGAIQPDEKNMINNIFEFNDKTAAEIMTHRTEVSLLWLEESDEQWNSTIREGRHSVYPVCYESADNIAGVLYAKDYYRLADRSRAEVMDKAARPAYFVPESVKTDILFRNMQKNRTHFAVVLDEYGGMSGIITINDLLEQIVGDLEDDLHIPAEEPEIIRIDSRTWKIKGTASLEDVSETLGVKLPEEYETFGGLVFGLLGAIPDDGARPELEEFGLTIKVTEIKAHRLENAIVCLAEPLAASDGDDEKDAE